MKSQEKLRFLPREGIGAALIAVVAFIALLVVSGMALSIKERTLFSSPAVEHSTPG